MSFLRRAPHPAIGLATLTSLLAAALATTELAACSADPEGQGAAGTGGAPSGGVGPGGATSGGATSIAGAGPGGAGAGGAGNAGAGGTGTAGAPAFDAGSDPNRNQVPGSQVCDRLATIQCAAEAACCSAPGRSFDACKATMKQGCTDQLYLDTIMSAPGTGYDQTAAAALFAEYERQASTCEKGIAAWGASPAGLSGLAPGTIEAGQRCNPQAPVPSPAQVATALASCKSPATTACYATVAGWTCSPRTDVGTPCFVDTNCNEGMFCDNPQFLVTGSTCKTRKAEGASCTAPNECASLLCRHSLCVPATTDNVFCLNGN